MANFERSANYQVSAQALASVSSPRSKFYMPHSVKTTFNVGELVPIGAPIEILPGDSVDDAKNRALVRLSTSKFPTMDNAYCDFYAFFVPWRLLNDTQKEFFGENDKNAWAVSSPPSLPSFDLLDVWSIPSSSLAYSLWDYFGLPVMLEDLDAYSLRINCMPFRGYKLIYNEYFRNQNTTAPLMVNTTGTDQVNADYFKLARGCRFHDRFSDCLPAPQKGPDVLIPGLLDMPVFTSDDKISMFGENAPLSFSTSAAGAPVSDTTLYTYQGRAMVNSSTVPSSTGVLVYPNNLFASATGGATIRALRDAFQVQRIYERDARCGSRYTEYLRGAFGVVSPDASLQRPQFLGTHRVALNMSQVVQQSSSVDNSPLGQVAGLSKTYGDWNFPAQGFTEHGYLYVLALARTERSYYGGIHKMFTRQSRFDVYDPALAMISEQPVYTRELTPHVGYRDDDVDPWVDRVFGYQAPWSEYKEIPSWVTGSFRPDAPESLSAWTYVDYYGQNTPTLTTEWMEESDQNMANTLAYNSDTQHDQILLDVRFDWQISRCMVVDSQPGLVDHF